MFFLKENSYKGYGPLYIKIQLDSEAQEAQTKEINKHSHLISFVCAL